MSGHTTPIAPNRVADAIATVLIKGKTVLFLLFIAAAVWSARSSLRLEFDPSYRIWFGKKDPLVVAYDRFLDTFGNDDAVTIVFTDPNGVFNDKALAAVKRISDEARMLPHVERVESLTTFQSLEGREGDLVVGNLVAFPTTPEALAHSRDVALGDARARGLLVSPDAKTTQIIATVNTREHSTERAFDVRKALEKRMESIRADTGYTYHVAGNPILETEYVVYAAKDVSTILPFFALAVVLLLAFMYRSVLGVLIPLAVSTTAVVITVGVAAALHVKLNALTTTVPQIVFAYGLSDGIHIYTAYVTQRNQGDDHATALRRAIRITLLPCFLSSFATAVGFASLATAEIGPMREIGILCAIGVTVEYVVAFFIFPTLSGLVKKVPPGRSLGTEVWHKVGLTSQRRPWTIVAISAVLVAIGGLAMTKLRVNSDIIAYFKERTPIRQNIDYINDNICGAGDYEFVVDTHKEKGLLDPAFLSKVARLEDFIKTHKEFTHVVSIVDVLELENRALHDNDPAAASLPDSTQGVAELLLLLEMSKGDEHPVEQLLSFDRSRLRISARVRHLDTTDGTRVIREIEQWSAKELPDVDVKVTGKNVMFTFVQQRVSKAFIDSIGLAVVLVIGALLLVFRSAKLAAIAVVPSIAPIVVTMGFMGASGIYLDFGTAMVASIALGIAVDDTIHIFSRFRMHGMKASELPAILRLIGFAMCWSSVLIIAGFSVFIASDFRLNSNFGVLTALVLTFGLLFDLFLTPALLQIVYRRAEKDVKP